jgi:glutathione synthase/RimK-type ligase-like ATP-grasp enzyme
VAVVNPPFGDNSNFSKPYHTLRVARLGGLTAPRTCVTDEPETAAAFVDACEGRVVFKGVSSMKTWATRYDPDLHRERLPLVRSCPVLLQEEIRGPDVRVHVLDERIFAEQIESDSVDYRRARGNRFRQVSAPPGVIAGCHALTRELMTPFLGIDFKCDAATGQWFFLEANPMPGFEGYDRRAEGAISAALVDWLRRPPRLPGGGA